jgi:hypothetical protein
VYSNGVHKVLIAALTATRFAGPPASRCAFVALTTA